jgi:hypothetical protein
MKIVKIKYSSGRNKVIEKAISEKLMRFEKSRLAEECAKLDPAFEHSIAEEGFSAEQEEWPEYQQR